MAVPTRASSAGRRGRPSAVGLRYPAGRLGPGSPVQSVEEALINRVTIGPSGHQITAMWRGSQAEYDALGSYSATTLYVIVG